MNFSRYAFGIDILALIKMVRWVHVGGISPTIFIYFIEVTLLVITRSIMDGV